MNMWKPGVLAWTAAAALMFAQNAGLQRTIVTRADVSAPGREAVITHVTLSPGASSGRHTHPGEEITYVLSGQAEILIDGREPLKVKSGDGFIVPNGAKHEARSTGTQPLELAAVYLIEKGQPIATPVP